MLFVEKLKKLVAEKGLSDQEIAEKLGEVSDSTVRRWRIGKAEPSLSEAVGLARLLKISLRRLACDSDDYASEDDLKWDGILDEYISRLGPKGICAILMGTLAEKAHELSESRTEPEIPDLGHRTVGGVSTIPPQSLPEPRKRKPG